jgi:periplasmic copper chaperone A
MRKSSPAVLAAVLVALFAAPAFAHVTVQPNEAPTGAFYGFAVRVPNERPNAATTKVEVQFPETVTNVSVQPHTGWDYEVKMKSLDEPIEVFGEEVTEAVDTITWSGGTIDPGEFDEFGFSVRTPDEPRALEFPALQTYDSGEVVRWIGPPDADEPAARVEVIDLGFAEGQGQLGLLAELKEQTTSDGSEDGDGPSVSAEPQTSDDGTDALTWVALIVGVAGLAIGGAALARANR